MKVVILCGGKGTRIRDVADNIPKPLIPVGEYPIIWHIMKHYASYGYNEFILCLGHLGWKIKEYFLNYQKHTTDFTLKLDSDKIDYLNNNEKLNWEITFVETGLETMTGGRVRKIIPFIKHDDNFMLTYGDGVSNVNIEQLINFHTTHGKICTVTGVIPPGRFGEMKFSSENLITEFLEKPNPKEGRINGGFFVLKTDEILTYLEGDDNLIFEREPLMNLTRDQELVMYKHDGFWQPMDTYRDYKLLNNLYNAGKNNGDIPWRKSENK